MKIKLRFQYNSPVVLTFALASLAALLLGSLTGGTITTKLFCVYRAPLSDPLTWLRAFLHVLGHGGWEHFTGNIMLILVVGPQLEEKYGSKKLLLAILLTAFVTGLAQCIFFPGVAVLGASGIVFMMILLASMGGMKDGWIPLTFILVTVFYLGNEIVTAVTSVDNVSQLSHIIGGLCGAGFGFYMDK
ncbi:MAG: rhomboid family intramembrane serine protease [Ruminococcaceae bacterium]|nr:rhomboid family intramembrane serine protease [Oscillospiraceae bacterium]